MTVMPRHDHRPGTYALILYCASPCCATVGKLGPVFIPRGHWVYVGSAFGPGGVPFRLAHHLRPTRRPHWHLDYIKACMQPVDIWITADPVKREHDWAACMAALPQASQPIAGFGASDCSCYAHLIHCPQRPAFSAFKRIVHDRLGAHGALFRWSGGGDPCECDRRWAGDPIS